MNTFAKRGLSLLLALVMCLGTLSGLTFTAEAASYVANWGERGTVATELSEAAVAFYKSSGTSYAALAALSGASSTSSVPSSALFSELQTLMKSKHTYETDYDETKNLYMYTDCQNGNTDKLTCIYCGTEYDAPWPYNGDPWNREHTWPKSKSLDGNDPDVDQVDEEDIMLLRPACQEENSSRSNKAYGNSTTDYLFYPNLSSDSKHDVRGDLARTMLYVYVRYGNSTYMWGTSGVMESKDVLIAWMAADPVDTWEMGRNDAVESITGTRNVFVDYPELAFKLFEEDVPANYQTPSNGTSTESYSITAVSNNTAYGTVSLSGNAITALPQTGYFVEGYKVTSGTATVTQNGNTFLVMPESDCSVMINFAAETTVTVSFSGASNISSLTGYAGESMSLPVAQAPEGYTFLGWMTAPLSNDTSTKPAYYTDSFTPTASTVLYALFSYVEEGAGTGDYVKVTQAPSDWSGEYLIVYEAENFIFDGSLSTLDAANNYQSVTISNNTISAKNTEAYHFTISKTSDGYSIQSASGRYIGHGSNANGLTAGTSALSNTISLNSDGSVDIICSGGAYLRFNTTSNQDRFRYYKSATYTSQKAISLYLRDGSAGTTCYTGNPGQCAHKNTVEIPAVAATCIATGLTSGIYCNDCNRVVTAQEVIPAIGHSYEGVVTKPTETEQGYTTYTCNGCGDSYISDYTEATGEIFTVNFWVPDDVANVPAMECGKNGINLPSAIAPEGYTFAGWALQSVGDTETAPAIYTANSTYTATANTDLYAVYSYTVGSGTTSYVLTDLADISGTDIVVITMTYTDGTVYALPYSNGVSAAPIGTIVTVSDGKLTANPADNLKWNISSSAAGYTFYPNGTTATWLYCTNTNNGVRVGTNTNKLFTLDGSGYLKNTATSRYLGVYRTNPDWRCYDNTTNNIKNQTLGFYVETQTGTTWYTSLGAAKPLAAVYSDAGLVKEYASLANAVAACESGQYIRLMSDVEAELTLGKDLYIDLNGHSITGLLTLGTYTVYGMDSTTDSYNGDSVGYFNCTDENDQPVVPVTHFKSDVTGSVKRYMAVKSDAGYSFHRFYMGITHASVKPGTVGVGYKAVFAGDDAVKAQIGSYGIKLWVEGNEAYTATLSLNNDDFVSGKAVTVRVDNIDAENYGETPLNAHVFMTLTDGTQVEVEQPTATISMTLRQMVENVNTNYTAYTSAQLAALKEMLDKFSITAGWKTENIQ